MSRPTSNPDWATDAAYPAGSDDWSAQPNKVEPTSGMKGTGFIPQDEMGADYLNWLLGNHADWIAYLDAISGLNFGDGSDGDVVLDGVAVPSFMTLSTGVYTLQRDAYIDNLTLDAASAITLVTNGFRLYVRNTLTFDGAATPGIANAGENGTTTGGAGGAGGSMGGGATGGDGGFGITASTAGGSKTDSIGGAGGAGGDSFAAGDVGGSTALPTAAQGSWRHESTLHQGTIIGNGLVTTLLGGAGGGGGGQSTSTGGGGGGGGGVVMVAAKNIVLNTDAFISANGGDGGSVSGGIAAGGGGGGGGGIFLTYVTKTLNGNTLDVVANGGAGGTGDGGGDNGVAGSAGTIIEHEVGA